jgi:hypothetical protein
MLQLFPDTGDRGAHISACGTYRYTLHRPAPYPKLAPILWIMLNPSTADASNDDPTIRRCLSFSRSWGYGRVEICNLFALRSTNPRELYKHADPVGPENDDEIRRAVDRSLGVVVVAWGKHGKLRNRDEQVMNLMRAWRGVVPDCLGENEDRTPKHPLYLSHDTEVEAYAGRLP